MSRDGDVEIAHDCTKHKKDQVYGKRQTSYSSWQFLNFGNERVKNFPKPFLLMNLA